MTALQNALEEWNRDGRLARVFQTSSVCALALHALRLEIAGRPVSLRWLYSWIIPSRDVERDFSARKNLEWHAEGEQPARAQIHRLVLVAPPARLNELMTRLLQGATLGEAATAIGKVAPTDFTGLQLGRDASAIEDTFYVPPVRFLPTRQGADSAKEWGRSLSSPSHEQPAFLAAFVRRQKAALFCDDAGAPFPGSDGLAHDALDYLARETGLLFTQEDAARLGNIEWMVLAAADASEHGDLTYETIRRREGRTIHVDGVRVAVKEGAYPAGTPLLVRCRCIAGHEIIFDQCARMAVGDERQFPATDDLNALLVTAWVLDDQGVGHLWFEDQAYLVRRIGIAMGIAGLSGSLDTDWTKSLRTSRQSVHQRLDRVRELRQVNYEETGVGDWAGWEASERDAVELAQRLFVPKSKARFFAEGWADDGPGALAFIEWLGELTADPSTSSIVLVDPYFDTLGVTEFLARARGTHIDYVVLTSPQTRSDDDTPNTSRDDRLRAAVEATRLMLQRLRFQILGVRRAGTSRDALFHDRYILVFSKNRGLTAGYNLSNSLQGATRHAPLLVTPIPADVLEQVGAYVAGLREPNPDDAVVDIIAESASVAPQPRRQVDPLLTPGLAQLMAIIVDEPALAQETQDTLPAALRQRALVVQDSFQIIPVVEAGAPRLVEALKAADAQTFALLWGALGEFWARSPDKNVFFERFMQGVREIAPALETYLLGAFTPTSATGETAPEASGLAYLFRSDFADVLSVAMRLRDYGVRSDIRLHYSGRLGIAMLEAADPGRLVRVCEALWATLSPADRQNDLSPELRTVDRFLEAVLEYCASPLRWDNAQLVDALSTSTLPVLRAVAAARLVADPVRDDVANAMRGLELFSPQEQAEILAEWIGECRLEANRRREESDAVRQQRLRLCEALIERWPSPLDLPALARLTRRMSGPGEGWGDSTTRDVFEPLVNAGKLKWDTVARLWLGELEKKLGKSYQFNPHADRPLSRAFVEAFVHASHEQRQVNWSTLRKLRERAARDVAAPFARSRHYEGWAAAGETLYWLKAITLLMRAAGLPPEDVKHHDVEVTALDAAITYTEPARFDGAAHYVEELTREQPAL